MTGRQNDMGRTQVERLYKKLLLSLMLTIVISSSPLYAQASTCLTACAGSSDYQHPNSFLHFSRNHFPNASELADRDTADNTSWRHSFDIVITQEGPQITVFDNLGVAHTFDPSAAGQFTPTMKNSGTLVLNNGDFQWTNKEGVLHQFRGSYLSEITSTENDTLKLNYDNRRLSTISNAQGDSITLNYRANSLASITNPQGTTTQLSNHSCPAATTSDSDNCDTEQHPIPGFNLTPTQSNVVRLDARPASCESYFIEYFGTTRGSEIENGLSSLSPYRTMQSTVRSFPIVDFISGDSWIVVRSRDLASPSFNDEQTPNALFYRLMRDGKDIQDRFLTPLSDNGFVTAEEQGVTTTLEVGPNSQNVVLQLIIRDQIASSAHWEQIERARELLSQRYDIHLEVVIIP